MDHASADVPLPPGGPPTPPGRTTRARWSGLAAWALLLLALVGLAATLSQDLWRPDLTPSSSGTAGDRTALDLDAVPSAADCVGRSSVTTAEPGVQTSPYRLDDVADRTTIDLRPATFHALMDKSRPRQEQNNYPVVVGENRPRSMCVLGGMVVGQQSRDLTWEQVKHGSGRHDGGGNDGEGVRVDGKDVVVLDGTRVSNTIDGVGVGEGSAVIRNMYATYIRDDCIEADQLSAVVVSDSLLDGCYMGISQRPGAGSPLRRQQPDPRKQVVLDHVLLRLGGELAGGHSDLFKWSAPANRLVLRDSVLMVEMESVDGTRSMDFPAGTEAHNVTLVWTGPGSYPGKLVPGVRVTKDRSIWDRHKADWLERHGCTGFARCDPDRLVDPVPPSPVGP